MATAKHLTAKDVKAKLLMEAKKRKTLYYAVTLDLRITHKTVADILPLVLAVPGLLTFQVYGVGDDPLDFYLELELPRTTTPDQFVSTLTAAGAGVTVHSVTDPNLDLVSFREAGCPVTGDDAADLFCQAAYFHSKNDGPKMKEILSYVLRHSRAAGRTTWVPSSEGSCHPDLPGCSGNMADWLDVFRARLQEHIDLVK